MRHHTDRPLPEATAVELHLTVCDPEVVAELRRRPEGVERDQFALAALRLGVLAIRQASGSLDAAALRDEADRMLAEVDKLVTGNARELDGSIRRLLAEYFAPDSGRLTERLDRLVRKDGELASLLGAYLEGDSSRLVQTLRLYLGEQSPVFRLLSPEQKDGLLNRLSGVLEERLRAQREQILQQFSLDDPSSALSRLVQNVSDGNGRLRRDLAEDLEKVKREFSLDNEQGALSRLTGLLKNTCATLEKSLTLDIEDSPLARLRRELLELLGTLSKSNLEFQNEVRRTLETFQARRQEAARGTQHGKEFEQQVSEVLMRDAQESGDICEFVGHTTGQLPRSKVGDLLITLGEESRAPGERIVVECKEQAGYTVAQAMQEIQEARRNRGAQIGVFVFSRQTAPSGLAMLRRVGRDILCVWDKDDERWDLILKGAVSVARAMAVRQRVLSERATADVGRIEQAVNRIEQSAGTLEEVWKAAGRISQDSQRILASLDPVRETLRAQIAQLREALADLKHSGG